MSLLTRLSLLAASALSIGQAQTLTIINPNFGNIPVACSQGYAYQSVLGGTCSDSIGPEQRLNSAVGMGWNFTPQSAVSAGSGLTNGNTIFNPPSFSGWPFQTAAFLQGPSIVSQPVSGFVRGRTYTLSFYLGSRYQDSEGIDGNQTVQAVIDGQVIGTWALVSYTPFSLRTADFTVGNSGIHILDIAGTLDGDHTAFFSGVSISAER
jgi:hypothetical protein